ncbi:MAG: WecB/TagA/CpsF family glycosyltransferase [Pseudomonadota bacterium]
MDTRDLEQVAGYGVYAGGLCGLQQELATILSEHKRPKCKVLACFNPHSYAVAKKSARFRAALHKATWLVPDGAGVVLVSRLRNGALRSRVTGSDVHETVMKRLDQCSGRVFYLGASDATLRKIRKRVSEDYPSVVFAGSYSPPYKDRFSAEENAQMISVVNSAKADVLWVGMTAPKQEVWLEEHREEISPAFAAGIGAVFDFYSGNVTRSSPLFQKLGLEWLPRLAQEPKRLWRRMFVSAPIFLWDALFHKPGSRH